MTDLIEIELTRIRKMAEHGGDNAFLLYLIDMSIMEANRAFRSVERTGAINVTSEVFTSRHQDMKAPIQY